MEYPALEWRPDSLPKCLLATTIFGQSGIAQHRSSLKLSLLGFMVQEQSHASVCWLRTIDENTIDDCSFRSSRISIEATSCLALKVDDI
jgi:hypothetical protein